MAVVVERPETARARRGRADEFPKPGEVRVREVPPRRVLEVKGGGRPDSESFRAAVSALYTVAYGVHFVLKRRGIEARVGALEGLWTFDVDPFAAAPSLEAAIGEEKRLPDPETWLWSLLIELPADATDDDVRAATVEGRKKHPSPQLDALRAVWLEEGEVVEAMHVGPYATEPETMARMHTMAAAAGLTPIGPHHEIYLGDPRRAAPERLRTVLRQPLGRESSG